MPSEDYRRMAAQADALMLAQSSIVEARIINRPVSDPALAGVLPGYVDLAGRWRLSPFHDSDALRLPELPDLDAPPFSGTPWAGEGTAAIGPASLALLRSLLASGGPRYLADLGAAAALPEPRLVKRRYTNPDLRLAHALMTGLEQRGLVRRRAIRLDELGRLRWVWEPLTPGIMQPSSKPFPDLAALSFETLAALLDLELRRERANLDGSIDIVQGGPRSAELLDDTLHEELPLLDAGDGEPLTIGVVLYQLTQMHGELRQPWAKALGEPLLAWVDSWLTATPERPDPWLIRDLGMELLYSAPWFGPSLRWTAGSLLRRKAPVGVLKALLFAGLWSDDLVARAAAGAQEYRIA